MFCPPDWLHSHDVQGVYWDHCSVCIEGLCTLYTTWILKWVYEVITTKTKLQRHYCKKSEQNLKSDLKVFRTEQSISVLIMVSSSSLAFIFMIFFLVFLIQKQTIILKFLMIDALGAVYMEGG